mmetsp:Transcript_2130/g.3167  ORF Transcript_2130/g.3167 Transcript_2130/m.3167 type:complete len:200 (+) Transcript_2130:216-815(+)
MHIIVPSALAMLAATGVTSQPNQGILPIHAGVEIFDVYVNGDGQQAREFGIKTPLPVNSVFEVKVSYLSTTPAEFSFALRDGDERNAGLEKDDLRRRRLNTERFKIFTDDAGLVFVNGRERSTAIPILSVKALATGVKRIGPEETTQVVHFNIAVDQLYANILPKGALSMVAWGVLCIFVAIKVLRPLLRTLLENKTNV